jgi:copper homeostasis protein CutC
MTYQLEVCIDNLESLQNALEGGATRIELCSSLSLGGLTPSAGLIKQASRLSSAPVYAMIRPRQGDFLFNEADVECMLDDIEMAKDAGMDGIVIYPSDFKLQGSEPPILFQFKEKTQRNDESFPSSLTMKWDRR